MPRLPCNVRDQLRRRNAVPVLVLMMLTLWALYTFNPGNINTIIGRANHGVQYAIRAIEVATTAKPIRIQYDSKLVPDCFKNQLDMVELCSWGNKPKQSWQRHYQNIFQKYNLKLTGKSYTELECNVTFKPTMLENMDVVLNYPFNVSDTLLQRLSLDRKGIDELSKPLANPRKYPIFVTSSSSNHYQESQGLIQTYHQLLTVHPELEMIYYDLGLSSDQRQELIKYCKCEVRTFDVEKYPSHISQKSGYAWKPVIIQTVLKEHDFVMWMDASIRFTGKPLDELSLRTRQRGIQVIQTTHAGGSITQRTAKDSFEFLQETPCLFNFQEVAGGWSCISRNRFTLDYFMKPWVSCALSYNCMVYNSSHTNMGCNDKQKYHDCHRFDQSILGILVSRLFNQHRQIVDFNVTSLFTVRREHRPRYFNKLKNKVNEKTSQRKRTSYWRTSV